MLSAISKLPLTRLGHEVGGRHRAVHEFYDLAGLHAWRQVADVQLSVDLGNCRRQVPRNRSGSRPGRHGCGRNTSTECSGEAASCEAARRAEATHSAERPRSAIPDRRAVRRHARRVQARHLDSHRCLNLCLPLQSLHHCGRSKHKSNKVSHRRTESTTAGDARGAAPLIPGFSNMISFRVGTPGMFTLEPPSARSFDLLLSRRRLDDRLSLLSLLRRRYERLRDRRRALRYRLSRESSLESLSRRRSLSRSLSLSLSLLSLRLRLRSRLRSRLRRLLRSRDRSLDADRSLLRSRCFRFSLWTQAAPSSATRETGHARAHHHVLRPARTVQHNDSSTTTATHSTQHTAHSNKQTTSKQHARGKGSNRLPSSTPPEVKQSRAPAPCASSSSCPSSSC